MSLSGSENCATPDAWGSYTNDCVGCGVLLTNSSPVIWAYSNKYGNAAHACSKECCRVATTRESLERLAQ